MRSPARVLRFLLPFVAIGAVALTAGTGPASAAPTCSGLPAASNDGINPATELVWEGELSGALNQHYIQVPFTVPAGTRGMRIRYCYENLDPGPGQADPTLDLGVYDALEPGADNWTMADLRGWSGSAIKVAGIGENGYTDEATYEANRKAYVPGRTNRAFTPGPVGPGTWAVELGAGWIPSGGVKFKLGIALSNDAGTWANDPFRPAPYQPYVANSKPGWYQGDVHVHGEQEPGNALMRETLDLAFSPVVPGQPKQGAGLDFVSMVDHNNPNNRLLLGGLTGNYPGKLVIPGVEITTYNGHINSQNAAQMVDFRTNPIHRFPLEAGPGPFTVDESQLAAVPGALTPADIFSGIRALGGWAQMNHPETFRSAPASCRGCGWTFDDAISGYDRVDAMEVANGIADLNHGVGNAAPNPFTPLAIKFYEKRLAAGDHIAAVGSSDDHRAGEKYGTGTEPITGEGTTVVYARQLSAAAVTDAIRNGYTYAKVFGRNTPDVTLTATTPEGYRGIPGRALTGRRISLKLVVAGAASNPRPGDWSVVVLRDGAAVKSFPVSGNSFSTSYESDRSGRYSFRLARKQGKADLTEAYSTPVWFTAGKAPSPKVKFGRLKLNRKRGTGTIRVTAIGAGTVTLKRGAVKRVTARTTAARRTVTLKLKPTARVKRKLKRRGRAKVKLAVGFSSEWTEPRTATKRVVLKQKVKKKRRKARRR